MKEPLISVITVCYNASATIEKTILSVISQSYSNIEYIIIDGGSIDGTLDIIKKYEEHHIVCISEKDNGVYDAMNKGAMMSAGDWINFMNCGDTFFDCNVISQVIPLLSKENASIVYGDVHIINKFAEYDFKASHISSITKVPPFCHQSSFIRTSVMQSHLFDISYKISSDRNLFYELLREGAVFEYYPVVIANYDISNGTISGNNPVKRRQEDIRIMKNEGMRTRLSLWADLVFIMAKIIFQRMGFFKIIPQKSISKKIAKDLTNSPLVSNIKWR